MPSLRCRLVAALLLALHLGGCATTRVGPPIAPSTLAPGTRVQVTASAYDLDRTSVLFERVDREALRVRMRERDEVVVIPLADVSELVVAETHTKIGTGLAVGGLIGLALGLGAMSAFEQQSFGESLYLILPPSFLGVLLGAMTRRTTEQPVDLTSLR